MSLVGAIHTTRLVIEPVHQSIALAGQDLQINHVLDEGILRRLATLGRSSLTSPKRRASELLPSSVV